MNHLKYTLGLLGSLLSFACAGNLERPERFLGDSESVVQVGRNDSRTPGSQNPTPALPDATPPPPLACASTVPTAIFANRCGGACHAGSMPSAGLDLVAAGVAERVIGQVTGCQNRQLIDVENPGDSYLLEKLQRNPRCGNRMPFGAAALTAAEIACVKAWIELMVAN